MKILPMMIIVFLTGCAAMETPKMQAAQGEARARYIKSLPLRKFVCINTIECEKAFKATKAYILENSDMKIQLVDSSMVSTYNPTRFNDKGMSAVRVPVEKEVEEIILTVNCKEYTYGHMGYCDNVTASIYEGFPVYLEARIK